MIVISRFSNPYRRSRFYLDLCYCCFFTILLLPASYFDVDWINLPLSGVRYWKRVSQGRRSGSLKIMSVKSAFNQSLAYPDYHYLIDAINLGSSHRNLLTWNAQGFDHVRFTWLPRAQNSSAWLLLGSFLVNCWAVLALVSRFFSP